MIILVIFFIFNKLFHNDNIDIALFFTFESASILRAINIGKHIMFNRIMSSLGIQGIQVDTRLHNSHVQAGQNLLGEVLFRGGSSNKNINGMYLQLMTTAEVESNDSEHNTALNIAQ